MICNVLIINTHNLRSVMSREETRLKAGRLGSARSSAYKEQSVSSKMARSTAPAASVS